MRQPYTRLKELSSTTSLGSNEPDPTSDGKSTGTKGLRAPRAMDLCAVKRKIGAADLRSIAAQIVCCALEVPEILRCHRRSPDLPDTGRAKHSRNRIH